MLIIVNLDVGSYYPHLMTINHYCSRNIPNPKTFEAVLDERMVAKKSKDMAKANALKLVVNTTYGGMLNKYNDLCDPLMGRSVCISGQLYLLELANHLRTECKTLFIVQLNTDGIMVCLDDSEYDKLMKIVKEWEQRTGFELEEDDIKAIYQKDVNNYIEVAKTDKGDDLKIKGGYLVRGVAKAGAFNVNNNATIVAKAIVQYFVNNIPPEQTINECDDPLAFQFIAKAGIKYKEVYHLVNDEKIKVQKVNRVYAAKDLSYGTLYKIKAENGSVAKIESLPEHCIIDNSNKITTDNIDKSFYIDKAWKQINDFLGNKPEKTKRRTTEMAAKKTETKKDETKEMTFLEKLFYLQTLMDDLEWEKDGKNMHQQYKYISEAQYKHNFKACRRKAGLLWECECLGAVYIPGVSDKMHLIKASFIGRLTDPKTGESREYHFEGTGSDNGDKALYKAYTGGLKFFLADNFLIAEGNDPELDDVIDEKDVPTVKENKPKAQIPPTESERKEIKKDITNPKAKASTLQISQLKKSLKLLREKAPDQEKFIQAVAEKTNGFTDVSKEDCTALIQKIGEVLQSLEG